MVEILILICIKFYSTAHHEFLWIKIIRLPISGSFIAQGRSINWSDTWIDDWWLTYMVRYAVGRHATQNKCSNLFSTFRFSEEEQIRLVSENSALTSDIDARQATSVRGVRFSWTASDRAWAFERIRRTLWEETFSVRLCEFSYVSVIICDSNAQDKWVSYLYKCRTRIFFPGSCRKWILEPVRTIDRE